MDRHQQFKAFVAVAEEGGFAAGARRVGLSAPMISRIVASLEADIGTRLFDRTTRSVALTQSGHAYYVDAKQILADIQCADARVAGQQDAPQ